MRPKRKMIMHLQILLYDHLLCSVQNKLGEVVDKWKKALLHSTPAEMDHCTYPFWPLLQEIRGCLWDYFHPYCSAQQCIIWHHECHPTRKKWTSKIIHFWAMKNLLDWKRGKNFENWNKITQPLLSCTHVNTMCNRIYDTNCWKAKIVQKYQFQV